MRVDLIAVGTRMPTWIDQGFKEYQQRLRGEIQLNLIEIEAERRSKTTAIDQAMAKEGQRQMAALPKGSLPIALDSQGQILSTEELASHLGNFQERGDSIALFIGGADGLAKDCLNSAAQTWSLSAMTFPHPLVRVIIAEQIYRASSILRGHPYHRS